MSKKVEKKPNLLLPILIFIAVVALVAAGSYFAFREQTETIQGQVEVTEYRVSSKVPSRVLQLHVKEGDSVRAGDLLVTLESPEVEAKREQADAAVAAAQAIESKAEAGAREEQIRGAYEIWQKAKVGVDIMQKSYDRIENLYKEGVVTGQRRDEVKAQLEAAQADERAAKSQYDMARNGAQRQDIQAAAAQVRRAQGAVQEVSSYQRETQLRASQDGEVTEIFPSVGELVGTGAPIMNVAVMQDIWVTFNVREDRLKHFAVGRVVEATVPALGEKAYNFAVYYIKDLGSYAAWKATKTTGQYDMKTFEVRCRPVTPIPGMRPGMSVLLKS
ncbi:MAG: efflux RND transporter periplasmic adaptor subunit [Bacteroidaceae bacterium]|nr:efflux RND transporter periplasmic adaptor subunit [Bacteroidaceae bacterium]MBR7029328.1 efflux RND transporter periplasmic adaptor subunit [Bacteroidaceae bacterium]